MYWEGRNVLRAESTGSRKLRLAGGGACGGWGVLVKDQLREMDKFTFILKKNKEKA